jgi:hypothetical protein
MAAVTAGGARRYAAHIMAGADPSWTDVGTFWATAAYAAVTVLILIAAVINAWLLKRQLDASAAATVAVSDVWFGSGTTEAGWVGPYAGLALLNDGPAVARRVTCEAWAVSFEPEDVPDSPTERRALEEVAMRRVRQAGGRGGEEGVLAVSVGITERVTVPLPESALVGHWLPFSSAVVFRVVHVDGRGRTVRGGYECAWP